jgi:hypothetical protein
LQKPTPGELFEDVHSTHGGYRYNCARLIFIVELAVVENGFLGKIYSLKIYNSNYKSNYKTRNHKKP